MISRLTSMQRERATNQMRKMRSLLKKKNTDELLQEYSLLTALLNP